MSENNTNKKELFFPFYINQGRLFDLYAILNDGYYEYAEISTSLNFAEKKGEKSSNDGFKVLEIGTASQEITGNTIKKVQTVTSILSEVKQCLHEKKYIKDIKDVKAGDFICIPVNLHINSVKALLEEVTELLKIISSVESTSKNPNNSDKSIQALETTLKSIKPIFGGEEVVYQTESYAIVGNITDKNLYQSVKEDLVGIDLKCLAQVKRVFPNGTELMRNTVFSRIKDHKTKDAVIEQINKLNDQTTYEFNIDAIPSISDKPVYQVEIIALYQ